MIDYTSLYSHLAATSLDHWLDDLPAALNKRLADVNHGDLARWQEAVNTLPDATPSTTDVSDAVRIGVPDDLSLADRSRLEQGLRGLQPWRKGPFELFGLTVDCEWRSDWKWQRISPHVDLRGRKVLDVGCGNGYHMWRMWGAGAETVIGIDPNLLFYNQFSTLKKYIGEAPVWQLPFTLEQLPEPTGGFDTVFSMGVLYHRRSPVDHLLQLKGCLRPGGELILETLVIEGDADTCLLPEDRYAQMRNVWFLPSVAMLERLLRRSGFIEVRCIDLNATSTEEQRSTEWMRFQSLSDFLDPQDPRLTVEGYPAPLRATLSARKP
ncbi:MAG: tRNA 5-methoxyuridine(34)/uridine 5-oxyacetic acid(34) synthase CmoB [Pseudomonas sp.]|nr:tRNA 5-methoxyuridine(34)/uridine 5-oxyacetic acid(34) synthase CmoB [Pseudomonas sp.]